VLIGLLIGGSLGLLAGFFRGKADAVLSAIFDALLAIPAIVMALALPWPTFADATDVSAAGVAAAAATTISGAASSPTRM
jgi:ABC-type dipeptide/oligopeptide/nickel transport system permease subunit